MDQMRRARDAGVARTHMGCSNLAHVAAAMPRVAKDRLSGNDAPNIGIVTAYNDMLSAHQPFERFPALIKEAARRAGATAQVAGGVPAMCDGVTQGQPGMELSLFSRDVIAMAAGVALSHNVLRRRGLPRRLRQDRARPRDRGGQLRPSACGVPARRPDALGPAQ
jgi:phosphogluconate dehydratase